MRYWFLLIMALCCALAANAQKSTVQTRTIEGIRPEHIDQEGYYTLVLDVTSPETTVEWTTAEWRPLPAGVPFYQPRQNELLSHISYLRKEPKLVARIPAFRTRDGVQEFLLNTTITIKESAEPDIALRPTYPENSVLSSGKWYKIGVTRRGIHKIDGAFLSGIGIDLSGVNPAHIRIYGNGGQVMTEIPDDSEPNDLVENALFVSTSGSSFGSSDYILFYAPGPVKWQYDEDFLFYHTNNYYSDTAYYFINVDKGPGKRIEPGAVSGSPIVTFDQFDDYAVVDLDSFHNSSAGKIWWSHQMYSDVSFSLTQNINLKLTDPVGPFRLDYQVGCTVPTGGSTLRIDHGSSPLSVVNFSTFVSYDEIKINEGVLTSSTSSKTIPITLKFTPSGTGKGLLDYLRVNGKSFLNFSGLGQLNFRNADSRTYEGQPLAYQLSGVSSATKVWDVTNPLQPVSLALSLSGSTGTVKTSGAGINELIAFNGSEYYAPVFSKVISNQNLHTLESRAFIIITVDSFLPVAQELAQLHQELDGITTHIVTTEQIYNEFSSGSQDIAGIRNFIRMFYDRAGSPDQVPENILLLGAASYDYKNRVNGNTNIVPNYQSYASANFGGNPGSSFSTDDYYTLLDSNEVVSKDYSLYDIGVGRIPARNVNEAQNLLTKIKHYVSPQSYGPWKNNALFLADDADGAGNFPRNNDQIVDSLAKYSPILNINKLYADAYPEVAGASGDTYPKVTDELNSQFFTGNFLLNYAGHGGPQKLADENILTKAHIGDLRNFSRLPVVITGTCDFGRYDNPAFSSGGMDLFMKPDGGSIASISTTTQVTGGASTKLITQYIPYQFNKNEEGNVMSMGQAMMRAKNASSGSSFNNSAFVLLGDPALKLAIPKLDVTTDSIKIFVSETETESTDTISALGNYILFGSVKDADGNVRSDFNGTVYVTIFDKPQSNPISSSYYPAYTSYTTQNSTVFKGQVSVTDGEFAINMVIPKDLNYEYGKGKISYYVSNEMIDGAGVDTHVVVGGFADFVKDDNQPPVVQPFIDDDKFRDGGVTGPDPMLYVKLSDDNGINISGSSIGHDLIAILDGDAENPYILNNYYFTKPDDFKSGEVYFPMSGLAEGWHEIEVRAWDVYNNSGSGIVRFEVRKKDEAVISETYTYPNPMTESYTNFVIQHNLKNENIHIAIEVYNSGGAVIKRIEHDMNPGVNRVEIPWNGVGESGIQAAPGVYMYRVVLKGPENIVGTAHNKLVIVR